ncbi:helix-turn-helix domain-containing protein [Halobacillus salinarum]|uniref:Helix-turn-helix domain-containing protein n=1 Tax=Halobacillus salinarum TaxID=2932257 RepID=A0ABY4EFY5_9BACI|nr:helix-turn-helix transcriptional regulator [Halobacillus salinarum]UOQ43389.1 helix-turn-helix domain-containing protein [Halobacillus salinarum]
MNIIGKRIKQLRENNNLSQKRVSEALGVSNVQLSRYESGSRQPDYETLKKIADYFEVSIDYLFGRSFNSKDDIVTEEFDSIKEINKLLDKYEIDDLSFFDIEKWKSMSPEQIRELESYFQYLVQKSKEIGENRN